MRKKILLTIILSFVLIIAGYTISNAAVQETDTFKINIPDKYKVEKIENGIYVDAQMANSNTIVGIMVQSEKNDTGEVIIPNNELLNNMINNYKEKLGTDNFSLISSKLTETNNCKGMEIIFKDREETDVMDYYTTICIYFSDKYAYNIMVISSDENYMTGSEKNSIINSFKVKDTVKNTNGIPFMDVNKSDWYYNSVKYVSDNKIITGTTAYTYNPNGKLTRGQLATILWRMEGSPKAINGKEFPDVKETDYYYAAIQWATEKKIVNGYKDGKFGPKDNITREQLAVMLYNYAVYKKQDISKLADISGFADIKGISDYAVNPVRWAIANKIISGKSNGTRIDPKGNATRAEAAAMIQNYKNNVK